jgi:N-acetylmuramic acid 6-phosphate (MurNAc-6-P) etherase
VKEADTYLPSDEEVKQMIAQGEAAAKSREPSAEDKKRLADAQLAQAKTEQILAEMSGQDAETQLDYMAMAQGKPKVYS